MAPSFNQAWGASKDSLLCHQKEQWWQVLLPSSISLKMAWVFWNFKLRNLKITLKITSNSHFRTSCLIKRSHCCAPGLTALSFCLMCCFSLRSQDPHLLVQSAQVASPEPSLSPGTAGEQSPCNWRWLSSGIYTLNLEKEKSKLLHMHGRCWEQRTHVQTELASSGQPQRHVSVCASVWPSVELPPQCRLSLSASQV